MSSPPRSNRLLSGSRSTRRSTSLFSFAPPSATDPNTRTFKAPCLRAIRRTSSLFSERISDIPMIVGIPRISGRGRKPNSTDCLSSVKRKATRSDVSAVRGSTGRIAGKTCGRSNPRPPQSPVIVHRYVSQLGGAGDDREDLCLREVDVTGFHNAGACRGRVPAGLGPGLYRSGQRGGRARLHSLAAAALRQIPDLGLHGQAIHRRRSRHARLLLSPRGRQRRPVYPLRGAHRHDPSADRGGLDRLPSRQKLPAPDAGRAELLLRDDRRPLAARDADLLSRQLVEPVARSSATGSPGRPP